MKRALLVLGLLCFGLNSFAQTFDSKFLDGTIMFQLNDEPTAITNLVRSRGPRETGLSVDINDYPELAKVFSGITVTGFEKPSYFTGKPALMKIFRIEFSEFSKIDVLIRELEKIGSVTFAEKEPIYTFDFVPNDTFHTGNNKWYHDLVGSENA